MSILLWITIELEYKMKYLKKCLLFTNGRQKFDPQRAKYGHCSCCIMMVIALYVHMLVVCFVFNSSRTTRSGISTL